MYLQQIIVTISECDHSN